MVSDKLRHPDEVKQHISGADLLKGAAIHSLEQYKHVIKIMDKHEQSHSENAGRIFVKSQEPSSEKTPEQVFAEEFKNALDSQRPEAEREASKRALEKLAPELGQKAVPLLVTGLASECFEERELVTGLLKIIGAPAMPALRKALASKDKEVQWRAREMLANDYFPSELQEAISQTPDGKREAIEKLLLDPKLDDDVRKKLLSFGSTAAPFLLEELSDMIAKDGKQTVKSDGGQKLQGLLKELGKEAAPAYFAVLDHAESQALLKNIATRLLAEISNIQPENTHPDNWLHDNRGRVRRIGKSFESDYVGNQLVRARAMNQEFTFSSPDVVKSKLLNRPESGSFTFNRVTEFKTISKIEKDRATVRIIIDYNGGDFNIQYPHDMWRRGQR
jgi:hypothetical protein